MKIEYPWYNPQQENGDLFFYREGLDSNVGKFKLFYQKSSPI